MIMAKEYVPIFFDWIDNTQDLSAEEKGHLIDAVILYASGSDDWLDTLETSGEKIAFRFMRGQIDRNIAISKARSEASSSKKDQDATKGNKREQNETNDNKCEQNETNSVKEKEKEKEKENKKREREQKQVLFDRFWSEYPRKESKPAARRAFDKLNVDESLLETMLAAIEKQKSLPQWNESGGQFIPYPATWLNNNRWEDEVKPISSIQPIKSVIAQQYEQRDYSGVQDEIMKEQEREIEEFLRQKGAG